MGMMDEIYQKMTKIDLCSFVVISNCKCDLNW